MMCYLWCSTYSAVDHVHVNISFFGPFVPEVGVIQRNVCTVSRSHKTSLKADTRITLNHDHICLSSWAAPCQTQKNSQPVVSLLWALSSLFYFTFAKVDPRPSDSMVMVFVLRWRIWSMSSSQNLAPSSSSSMMAPYAPRRNRSSISFLESCCCTAWEGREEGERHYTTNTTK